MEQDIQHITWNHTYQLLRDAVVDYKLTPIFKMHPNSFNTGRHVERAINRFVLTQVDKEEQT